MKIRALIGTLIIILFLGASIADLGATTNYTYDNLNRLTKVDYGNGTFEEFTYDAAGNRLSHVAQGANNNAPYFPSLTAPSNVSTDNSINTALSWQGGDPDPTDTVTYDVYLDTNNPPLIKVSENQADSSYLASGLAYRTTYFWKIVARDNHGAETEGPIWSFTTVKEQFALNILIAGTGSGKVSDGNTIDCSYNGVTSQGTCSSEFASGNTVNLTVTPESGSAFAGWSGDCTGTNTSLSVLMDKAKTCTATFNATTAPTGSITINNGNEYTTSPSVTLNLAATDADGVSQMCISNTPTCELEAWQSYTSSIQWTLESEDGIKTIYAWFKDSLGNANAIPVSDSITLDTASPILTVSTLSDGSWTNNETLNVSGTVTDNIGMATLTVNGIQVTINEDTTFSYAIVLQGGENIINIVASDLAGNQKTDTRTIYFDATAPNIVITSPADNSKTKQSTIELTGTVDEDSTVTVSVNGGSPLPAQMNGSSFSLNVTLTYGMNTVEATAADLAGNTSTVKRTVTYDDQNPSLSITQPAQDIKTSQNNIVIKGEVSDITEITVTITMDGEVYTPDIIDGKFEQPLSFALESIYQIYVNASDEVGNETIVQRNIIYDKTAPAVTLDTVTSPTNQNSQVLTGTMEEGATVVVDCPTASVGTVTYPTLTTWTVNLTNLTEGNNEITITASDAVPNTSDALKALIIVDTMKPVTTATPGGGTYNTYQNVVLTANEPATIYYTADGSTPTTSSAVYSSPISIKTTMTLQYFAMDSAGNSEDRNLANYIIDINVPDTTIIGKPANQSNSTSATFTFISTEPDSVFECKLDSEDYVPCTSPKVFDNLSDGIHVFSVRAADLAGNADETPASYTWTIDSTAPSSTIMQPLNGMSLYGDKYTVTGEADDGTGSGVQKVEVSTDGGATWNLATGTTSWSFAWNILGVGSHNIRARATDFTGNVETAGTGIGIAVVQRQPSDVVINNRQLSINGQPLTLKGVVYSPVPIGDDPQMTPPYGDYFTSDYSGLYDRDLPFLRDMGANAVRLWSWNNSADHLDFLDKSYNGGVEPIYVIAGYQIEPGLDIDPNSPNNVREELKADFREMVSIHKNHPAILAWAIGSGLNAGNMYGGNLANLFSLVNEMAAEAHEEEGVHYHPVAAVLADTSLISTIATYDVSVPYLDIWGANIYRGNTFGTFFNDFRAVSSKPVAILEYGIDAYDNANGNEYEKIGVPYQANYAEALWIEIGTNSDVCIGGTITEFSDEWWKGKNYIGRGCPDNNPSLHSICGFADSYQPDGYSNAEWWGIMRTKDVATGPDIMEPRAVYSKLQSLWVARLSVIKAGTGSGIVTSSDGKIACGTDCSETYSTATEVTLTAVPDTGSVFSGWSGCTPTESDPKQCTAIIDKNNTVSATFQRDTNPPTGSIVINGGAEATNSRSVVLTLSASDDSGGSIQMCISNTSSCRTWEAFATTKSWTLTSGSGTKLVNVWFRDQWGNSTPQPYADTIILDTTAPVDGTMTHTVGNAQLTLNWNGFSDTESGIGGYAVVYGRMATPKSCSIGTPVPGYDGTSTNYVHTGLINGNTYYYRACAIDKAGNMSAGATTSASPISETNPPTGSIVINGGDAATGSTSVTLTLSASDESGGTIQMCISNTTACTSWTAFATTKSWTLTRGDANKTVYARFKDTWGNENSNPYSDNIILDTTAPANGTVTAAAGNSQITLNWSGFSDTGSGIGSYTVVYATGKAPKSCSTGIPVPGYDGTSTTYIHTGLTNGTTYSYRVCATDKAGNTSSGATASAKPQ